MGARFSGQGFIGTPSFPSFDGEATVANSILTVDMITREAIELFRNSNAFLMNINRQFDSEFARAGMKIGQTLRIRLPNDYTVRTGPALATQNTNEVNTTLTVATQKGVDLSFSTADRTMNLQDYSERILAPAVNVLAGAIAADVMSGATTISNMIALQSSGATITPGAAQFLQAGAVLDNVSAPLGRRMVVVDPLTDARVVSSLAGLFNPSTRISQQYETGAVKNALGFDWVRDQTVLKLQAGSFPTLTVNGASQTGLSLNVAAGASPATINQGDVFTIAGVYAVNRVTKQSTGQLQQFVATAPLTLAASGTGTLSIYPALTPASSGNPVQYQTVTVSPANGAVITGFQQANETARRNFAFCSEAVTIAFAELELPRGVHEASRVTDDDISIRIITDYIPTTDQMVTRLDVLYGYTWVRPEWAAWVLDQI